jgi:hypothetical protein
MDELIDGWDIAAQIRMERQIHKGSFLLVEGHNDDRTLSNFIDETNCSMVISFGKENAMEALRLLEEDGFEGVVCVVDSDFDHIDGVNHDFDSLILTEHHDMDMTLFMSDAFVRVLYDAGIKVKSDRVNASPAEIRKLILGAAGPLASLRWLSYKREWRLNFKDIDFIFISRTKLECDISAMIDIVSANSSDKSGELSPENLKRVFRLATGYDLSVLCNGHDVMTIFGIGLTDLLGNLRIPDAWGSKIATSMRAQFDRPTFERTDIYRKLRAWETANPPFKILNEPSVGME